MTARVLLLVNGLGLGNSTRCHAAIQALAEHGANIAVATSGNGLWYFRDRPEIGELHELESLRYGQKDGKLSVAATLASVGTMIGVSRRNDARIAALVETFRPDVAVIDSSYSVCGLKRAGVPIVAINNADVVHVAYHQFRDRPASIRAQFLAVEENDYRFHRWVPDLVASPCLDPALPQVGRPFLRVGPIVRRGYEPAPTEGPPSRVLVMLSGSVFGTPVALSRPIPGVRVDVVGRERPEGVPEVEGIVWHGKVRDNRALLEPADLAVVNGGFSAVSELFAMRKPMIVIPVPNHAEQWVNARSVQHLGVGAPGTEETLEADLLAALARLDSWRDAYRRLPPPGDGAQQAAAAILGVALGR
jgi:UDP:flavonoid glycosyltransferase YjiC (YdhE family)